METEYILAGIVIAVVIFLIYRKSQKSGKAPRVGSKGSPRPGPGDDR